MLDGADRAKLYSEIVLNNKAPDPRIDNDINHFLEPLFTGEHGGAIIIYRSKDQAMVSWRGVGVSISDGLGLARVYQIAQEAAFLSCFRPFNPDSEELA